LIENACVGDIKLLRDNEVVRIRDVMSRNIVYISLGTSVMEAAKIMTTKDISSILIKSGNEFVGIITDRDIISMVVALGLDAKDIIVGEIMSKPLITINKNACIDEAAEKMRDNKIRRLIVKNKGDIVGIISESDIVRIEPDLHLLIREHSRLKMHPSSTIESRERMFSGFCEECQNYSEDLINIDGRWFCEECRT
jgi:CBS domain-containing protein